MNYYVLIQMKLNWPIYIIYLKHTNLVLLFDLLLPVLNIQLLKSQSILMTFFVPYSIRWLNKLLLHLDLNYLNNYEHGQSIICVKTLYSVLLMLQIFTLWYQQVEGVLALKKMIDHLKLKQMVV